MTATDITAPSQTDSVSLEFDLRHPPAKVWRALTDPALLAQWLMPVVEREIKQGAPFTFQAPPQPEWNGTVNCRVLAMDPPSKLSYTWVVGDVDTVVVFDLTPTESGTRLALVQSGFKPEQKRNFGGARYGWKMMGEKLSDVLDRSAE